MTIEPVVGASTDRDAHAVRERIQEILGNPQFGARDDWLQRWIGEFLESLLGIDPQAASAVTSVLVWTFLTCSLVVLVLAVMRALRSRAAPASEDPASSSAREERVAVLRERARAAEKAGDLVLALRLYFTALVVALGEHGDLEYRDAWTNRELLERGKPGPRADALLRPLVPALDRHSFGGEPATRDDVARLAALLDSVGGARA